MLTVVAFLLLGCGANGQPYYDPPVCDYQHQSLCKELTVAMFGDFPYVDKGTDGVVLDQLPLFPDFISKINDANPDLVLYCGDLHSGKTACTAAYNAYVYNQLNRLTGRLVYALGDNEWSDCHKSKQGGAKYVSGNWAGNLTMTSSSSTYKTYWCNGSQAVQFPVQSEGSPFAGDPIYHLQLVRSQFFANPRESLGCYPTGCAGSSVVTQAEYWSRHPHGVSSDSQFVEHTFHLREGVLVVSLNVPGSSNNGVDSWWDVPLPLSARQNEAVSARTGATLRWLDLAFAHATAQRARAIILLMQADMWDCDGVVNAHIVNFRPYVQKIADLTLKLQRPVLLVNNDVHIYKSNNPLRYDPLEIAANCPHVSHSSDYCPPVSSNVEYCLHPLVDANHKMYGVPDHLFHRIATKGSTLDTQYPGTSMEYTKLTITTQDQPTTASSFGPFKWERVPVRATAPCSGPAQ